MKSVITLGLALAVGAFGSIGVATTAQATNLNHSGTICKNFNASEVLDIDYLPNGTRNLNVSPRSVVCPIVRSPTSTNTLTVYVDGKNSGAATTTCTLYSYNYTGAFMGSTSFTAGGTYDRLLSLASPQAPNWAAASLICGLPGSAQGTIYDIDVVQ
ncbi:MAG TPA: hypothetical protein VN989_01145 [Casimicrobiaceae bacterium]|nr:hypothetical protein [Casimicrobiaceae bacterium]